MAAVVVSKPGGVVGHQKEVTYDRGRRAFPPADEEAAEFARNGARRMIGGGLESSG